MHSRVREVTASKVNMWIGTIRRLEIYPLEMGENEAVAVWPVPIDDSCEAL